MVQYQQTLKASFSVDGKGLHTGVQVKATFNPAPVDFGIKFKRIDTEPSVMIDAIADNVVDTRRGTVIANGKVTISTIEHALAALTGYEIHNCLIEVSGPELPILDGSSSRYAENISSIGVDIQDKEVDYFVIKEKIVFHDPETGMEIIGLPDDTYSVNSLISYPVLKLKSQFASFTVGDDFQKEIASCRTFVFISEIEQLLNANLIKGGELDNAIIFIDRNLSSDEINHLTDLFDMPHIEVVAEEGILNNIDLHFPNEPARHKLLDIIGDLTLIGKPIKGRVIATKPGHTPNIAFAKLVRSAMLKAEECDLCNYDPNEEPLMDIVKIRKTIPHRYPFLLVDKVIKIKNDCIYSLKNITSNEPFFIGHFPEEPVMPGVLLIEAMAQTGGLLVLGTIEDPERYSTYFLKIDGVKFRKKVTPGDSVIFKVKLVSPIRRGIAEMKAEAFVGKALVAEATFMAQIIKNK